MVGIREFYEKDGKVLPGKKASSPRDAYYTAGTDKLLQGISLSIDQYKTFISLLPEIERVLESKGVQVPRPQYDAPSKSNEDDGEGASTSKALSKRNGKTSKPNHEATSDEDEE